MPFVLTRHTAAPNFVAFDINVDSPVTLTLIFDDNIDVASVDTEQLTLQSSSSNPSKSRTLTSTAQSVQAAGQEVTIILGNADSDSVRGTAGLCEGRSTSFLAFGSSAFSNLEGISAPAVATSAAVQARAFTGTGVDGPVFLSSSLNMNQRLLQITADRQVTKSGTVQDRILFQSVANGNEFRLSSQAPGKDGKNILEFVLSNADISEIATFLVPQQGLRIILGLGASEDTSGQDSLPGELEVTVTLDDAPVLLSWKLDYVQSLITLEFNVDVKQVQSSPRQFQVQSEIDNGAVYTFAAITATFDGPSMNIVVETDDVEGLVAIGSIGTKVADTFLVIDGGFVLGSNNNQECHEITSARAFQATQVITDQQGPQMLSANLRNPFQLTICFSETITDLDPTAVKIQSSASNPSSSYSLTSGTTVLSGECATIELSSDDRAALISDSDLATARKDTFISVDEGGTTDPKGNPSVATSPAIQVDSFQADLAGPVLTSVELVAPFDLVLCFSEEVFLPFDSTQVKLQSAANNPVSSRTLSGGTASVTDKCVTIPLTEQDREALTVNQLLATTVFNTFVSLPGAVTIDRFGHPSSATAPSVQASTLGIDVSGPDLISAELLEPFTLKLCFSEDIVGFEVTDVVIQSSAINPALSHTLSGGTATIAESCVDIPLEAVDREALGADIRLAVSTDTTFVALPFGTTADVVGNPSLFTSSGVRASLVTVDVTRPELESVELLEPFDLKLCFSENIVGLVAPLITIQSAATNPSASHTLSGGAATVSGRCATVPLEVTDQQALASRQDLATEVSNTFVSLPVGATRDELGNPNAATAPAVQATTIAVDASGPALVEVQLLEPFDLQLCFSENIDGFKPSDVIVQSASENPSTTVSLSGGDIDVSGKCVTISLEESDQRALASDASIATSSSNTFVSLPAGITKDGSNNPSFATGPAIQATALTIDTSGPDLTEVQVLEPFDLKLCFSENIVGFEPDQVTIQSSAFNPDVEYQLTGGVPRITTNCVTIPLSVADQQALGSLASLGTSANDFFVFLPSGITADETGNPSLPTSSAVKASVFDVDTTSIAIVDMELRAGPFVAIEFLEAFEQDSPDLERITLTNADTGATIPITGHVVVSETLLAVLFSAPTSAISISVEVLPGLVRDSRARVSAASETTLDFEFGMT